MLLGLTFVNIILVGAPARIPRDDISFDQKFSLGFPANDEKGFKSDSKSLVK